VRDVLGLQVSPASNSYWYEITSQPERRRKRSDGEEERRMNSTDKDHYI